MSLVYVSSLSPGKDCLVLIRHQVRIDHVVTIDADLAARTRVGGYADFRGLGPEVHYVHRYSMTDARDWHMVNDLAPDLMIVNGWNRLIPPSILALPRAGCVGFHGSWKPLPFGRGRSPVTWAILNDASEFYLHLFSLDEGIDSGDVIDTARFDVTPDDTCGTLLAKIGVASAGMLLANIAGILDGTAPRTPQTGTPTYLPKRRPEEGRIDWTRPVKEVCRLVRAVTHPYPGAFTDIEYRGHKVRMTVWDAIPFSSDRVLAGRPGTIVQELDGKPLVRGTDGVLLVREFSCAPAPAAGSQ